VDDGNDPAISEALPYWAADSEDPNSDIFDAMYLDVQNQVKCSILGAQFSTRVADHTLFYS
jgi:hypothetical protein